MKTCNAADKYHKKAMTVISVRLHNENDKAIIEFIKSQPNQAEWLRNAVRKEIAEKNN